MEDEPKAPDLLATTPRCWGEYHSFPRCALLIVDCTLICWVLSKEASSTILGVFDMTRPRIEPRASTLLVNTLTIMSSIQFIFFFKT